MIRNERVRLTFNGRTVNAVVRLGSDNRKSLVLEFNSALCTPGGGLYCGSMAVLFNEERQRYEELVENAPVEVHWRACPQCGSTDKRIVKIECLKLPYPHEHPWHTRP